MGSRGGTQLSAGKTIGLAEDFQSSLSQAMFIENFQFAMQINALGKRGRGGRSERQVMWLGGRSCTHVAQVTVTASTLLSSLLFCSQLQFRFTFRFQSFRFTFHCSLNRSSPAPRTLFQLTRPFDCPAPFLALSIPLMACQTVGI